MLDCCFVSFSLDIDNNITGGTKLTEILKSNTSLTSLDLSGSILVASFRTHMIQAMILVPKVSSSYLKCSDCIHPLQHSISAVTVLLRCFILTQNTGTRIYEGVIKLSEALKSLSSLTFLDLYRKSTCSLISFSFK
jgi:hypothetical protein